MKYLVKAVISYWHDQNKKVLVITTLMIAGLIALNYSLGIEKTLSRTESFPLRIAGFWCLYLFAFSFVYALSFLLAGHRLTNHTSFFFLLLITPLLFALKIGWQDVSIPFIKWSDDYWKRYQQIVVEWPVKCLLMTIVIVLIWKMFRWEKPIAGTRATTSLKPYLLLLLMMVPLIAFAATQADFGAAYPKLKRIAFIYPHVESAWPWKWLFEAAYGSDFITIELFFRGFVVLAFARWVGKDAILPMAAFYCTIHFGKPLFECISSYFGGMILGIVVYQTRSIWGGLIVHLGIAWMMEAAGQLLN